MEGLVSIIITTYKGSNKLIRAIDSALNQSYRNVEVLVVDDNDPNSPGRAFTEELIEKYSVCENVHYVKHLHNLNGAVARNTGICNAKGGFIAFLDDDDYFLENRVEVCLKALEANTDCVAVYTDSMLMCKGEIVSRNVAKDRPVGKDVLLNQNLLGTGSNLFLTRACCETVGGFDVRFLRYQDVEFIMRVLKIGRMCAVNEVTVVKDIEDVRFMPAYQKLLDMQKLFNETFKGDIEDLENEDKWTYYKTKMNDLFIAAYATRKMKNIYGASRYLKSVYKRKQIFEAKMFLKAMMRRF